MRYAQVAKAERLQKEKHPEEYCPHPNCLWRTPRTGKANPCHNHRAAATELEAQLARSVMMALAKKGRG